MRTQRKVSRTWLLGVGMVLALLGGAAPGHADLLPPGGMVTLGGVAGGPGAGTVLADDLIPFVIRGVTGAPLFQGTLEDQVVRLDSTGELAFVQFIRDTEPGLNGSVTSVVRDDFTGFLTDVNYSTTSAGTRAPDSASRTATGASITFNFTAEPILSGQDSRGYHISTNAPFFTHNGSTEIRLNNGASVVIATFAPVPEPSSWFMLSLGVIGLLGFGGRRRAAKSPTHP